MVEEVMKIIACSGNKIKNNPYTHEHTITTKDIADLFNISDFGIKDMRFYDCESSFPEEKYFSENEKRYFYGSGAAHIEADNGEEYIIVVYPQYDPNIKKDHFNGEPHFNYYVNVYRLSNGEQIGKKKAKIGEISHIPYNKIRTQYKHGDIIFADHTKDAPK